MSNNQTSLLCEQGDMGLWNQPLSRQDQQAYDRQQSNENNQTETKADE